MSGVLVDQEVLEQLIAPEVMTGQNPEDFFFCRHCDAHWTDKTEGEEYHEKYCPVPALRAALALPAQAAADAAEQVGILAGLDGYVGTHNPHLFGDAALRDAWERGNARVRAVREEEWQRARRVAEEFFAMDVDYAASHLALRDLLSALRLRQGPYPPGAWFVVASKFDFDKARHAYDLVEARRLAAQAEEAR